MSVEGCALQLLRAVGIGTQHMLTLLQPFRGQMPQTEAQFQELTTQLRMYGHISEGAPGNIASPLQGPFRQARPGAYLEQGGGAASSSTTPPTFFGNPQDQAGEQQEPWAALLPSDAVAPPPSNDPFAAWASGAGDREASQQPPQPEGQASMTYPTWEMDDSTSSSCTSSDDGQEPMTDVPDTSRMNEQDAAEAIYFRYRQARRAWRRYTGNRREDSADTSRKPYDGKEEAGAKAVAEASSPRKMKCMPT